MRNRKFFILPIIFLFLTRCNIPKTGTQKVEPTSSGPGVLWDLDRMASGTNIISKQTQVSLPEATSTPQLVNPINFDEAFSHIQNSASASSSEAFSSSPVSSALPASDFYFQAGSGNDRAEWLYFSPPEYSSDPTETVYAAFKNSGDSVWTEDYHLEFYAGSNPSRNGTVPLSKKVNPGEQASFQIPVTTTDNSWKACWQLKNPAEEAFYDFCYSHGNGTNTQSASSNTSASSDSGVFWAFVKTDGSAPAHYADNELSAELVSTSPASGHNFKAYDHYEDFRVSLRNTGNAVWNSSYSLVFYSGYNWMHSNSFPLSGNTDPGETATITMPMEIFEDNDRWVTCWYFSSPDGKNLADFCFNYTTTS